MPTLKTSSADDTAATHRRQQSLLHQALRFVALNVKIFRLTRQHH